MKKSSATLPISISLKVAGQDQTIQTDNVLKSLRELNTDPKLIKSRAVFEVTYKGDTYRRIFNIIQLKRLLSSDIVKIMTAKNFNLSLGIPVEDYA